MKHKKAIRIISLACAAVIVILIASAVWTVARFLDSPLNLPQGRAFFEVHRGWNVRVLASELRKQGLINSSVLYRAAYSLFLKGNKVKAGEYEFIAPVTVRGSFFKMVSGKVYLVPVTVPEGLTGKEIGALLTAGAKSEARGFDDVLGRTDLIVDLDPDAPDLEGYLFPETYLLPRKAGAPDLARAMTEEFRKVFDQDMRRKAAELKMTVRQVIVLASLIEKETARPEERPLVSAVFHNRLKLGMKLDCDPTVIYALERAGLYRGRLLLKDLEFDSPYNTYRGPGLPPGPICNPGRTSIAAALNPAAKDYLYFVARHDGSHQFSSTYGQHLAAVKKFKLK